MLQSNGYFILTFILSFRLPSLLMSLLRLNPNFLLPSPKSNLPSLLKLWRMKLLLTHLLLPPSRLLKPKLRLLSLTLKLLRLKPMLKLLLSRNNLLSRRLLPLLRSFSSLSPNKYFCLFHFFFFFLFFLISFFFFFYFSRQGTTVPLFQVRLRILSVNKGSTFFLLLWCQAHT